jgi:uncharacterized protein
MRKLGIVLIAPVLLIVIMICCFGGCAGDQGQVLIEAAKQGDLTRVKDLLDKGADVNATDSKGATALWEAALGARSKESCEIARMLLNRGADPNAKDKNGRTALMWASGHGPVELVTLFLDKGAEANDGVSLPEAVLNEHNLEVVKLLLDRGAKDDAYRTALKRAKQRGATEIVELLKAPGAKE